jgi:hypothetical protein
MPLITNEISFRYWMHSGKFHKSSILEHVTHDSYSDLIDKIHVIIDQKIQIPGDFTINTITGDKINDLSYDHIPPRAKLYVTIGTNPASLPVFGNEKVNVNRVVVQYYTDLPDRMDRTLRVSRVNPTITHKTFSEMMREIHAIAQEQCGYPSSEIEVALYPSRSIILERPPQSSSQQNYTLYSNIPTDSVLVVTITQPAHQAMGSSFALQSRFISLLQSLNQRIENLETH